MSRRPGGFTLIEVMLAVAIFAFAVVGFGVALNDVLGVNSEILRTSQRRQAIESVAAEILASSNNLVEIPRWTGVPGWESESTWTLEQKIQQIQNAQVTGPNNIAVPLLNFWRIELRASDPRQKTVDQISFILYGIR
jgi:prepilin-type N-terminal cleavage/methylation domain-containing protein